MGFERISSVDTVIGKDMGPEERESILQDFALLFRGNKNLPGLEQLERQKNRNEKAIINIVNPITDSVSAEYGGRRLHIPPDNIHVVKPNKWPFPGTDGRHELKYQAIMLRSQGALTSFASVLSHEMLHFKSFGVFERRDPESSRLTQYRSGLNLYPRRGERRPLFRAINEAVIEGLNRRCTAKILQHPLFQTEVRRTRRLKKYLVADPPRDADGQAVNVDNIYLIEEAGGERGEKILGYRGFAYPKERLIVEQLISKLWANNTDRYKSPEDVFTMFARAVMANEFIPLARVVDRTFGRGTFRTLGQASAVDHDESLDQFRDLVDRL